MTNLGAASPPAQHRDRAAHHAVVGALLGTLLFLEIIAVGIPMILAGSPGYAAIPVGTLVGALLGATRARRWMLTAVVALGVVIAVVAYTPAMRVPTRALVRADPVGGRPLQAIVVLSGGVTTDGHLKPQPLDRMLTALDLVRRRLATTLIVSRDREGPGDAVTPDADWRRLLALVDEPVRFLIVDSVFSTRDEAVRMHALARSLDISSVAVVTSPLHTYRACAAFEKVGFVVTCVPSESRAVALRTLGLATDRVRALQLWLYECAGLALYRLRGWV